MVVRLDIECRSLPRKIFLFYHAHVQKVKSVISYSIILWTLSFSQLVVHLVKNERMVVRAIEEACLLSIEWQVARDYCKKRVDTIQERIIELRNYVSQEQHFAPLPIPQYCYISPRADLYVLEGSVARPGELSRWQDIMNELDILTTEAFTPKGRMYYAHEDEDDE